jgi:hypothetical protein
MIVLTVNEAGGRSLPTNPMLTQDHGYTCTTTSVDTVSTTIYDQRLLSQHV